jgi:hypothetical protein
MENKKFYIKYLTNQPIKVETHFIGEQDRRRPLTDVGDLIGAFQARPGSLLANTDSGLITLHLPEGAAKDSLERDFAANRVVDFSHKNGASANAFPFSHSKHKKSTMFITILIIVRIHFCLKLRGIYRENVSVEVKLAGFGLDKVTRTDFCT